MCEEAATAENIRAATPYSAPGSAVDPITLTPVDEVVVTTLVDNVYDGLVAPTVGALTAMAPDLLVPGHCTGWHAQHTLAAEPPDSWVQGSSGTRYRLSAD
jgi:hypothetical protein